MPWKNEASVVTRKGIDYWRTWFIEECEESELFGLNEKHLPLVTKDIPGLQKAYREGTEIFLEDAPFFKTTKTHHRVCGPYLIKASIVHPSLKIIREINGKAIIFKEKEPSKGPWFDKAYVCRLVDGVELKYKQFAKEFSFFPYRFSIHKSPRFKVHHVKHEYECWLCVK